MAIKAFSGGISQQPLPDFLLTDIQDGDFLQFEESVKAFINIRNINVPTDLSDLTDNTSLLSGGGADLTNYYTKTETNALIPTNVSVFTNNVPYLTSADLPDTSNFLIESQVVALLDSYATEEWVQEQIAQAELDGEGVDLSVYITQSELTTQLNALPNAFSGDYNDLTNKPDLSNFVTQADINASLPDLSSYVTNSSLTTTLADYYTKTQVDALIPTPFSGDYDDLTNTPTIPTVPTNVSEFTNDSGYVTQSDIDASLPDLSPYALTVDVPSPPDLTNYALKSELPSLTGYATTAYVDSRHQTLSISGNILSISNGNNVDLSGISGGGGGGGGATSLGQLTDVSNVTPTTGHVLKYNGTTWEPATDNTSAGGGISNVVEDTTPQLGGDLDAQAFDITTTGKILYSNVYSTEGDLPSASTYHGMFAHVHSTGAGYFAHGGNWIKLANHSDIGSSATSLGELTDVSNATPTTGYVLKWSGTQWEPSADNTSGAGGSNADTLDSQDGTYYLDYNNFTNTPTLFDGAYGSLTGAPTIPADISDLTDTTNLLSGASYNDAAVDTHLNTSTATTGQVLSWDGTDYDWVTQSGGGSVDLTGYATQTFVNQQIANASVAGIADLDDLNDVAIGSLPTVADSEEFYLLEYNPVNSLWESKDFGNIFATQAYVTATVATALTDGDVNLDGYATEQYVEQKIDELPTNFSGNYSDLANRPILFSGDYNDLSNTPAGNADLSLQLVGQQLQLINIEPDPDTVVSTVDLSALGSALAQNIDYSQLDNLPSLFSGDYSDLVNRPQLFSGNYADLTNKPYIPSIAGLSTEAYVDNRWAEPEITGDRVYTDDIEYRATTSIVVKPSTEVCARHDNYVMCVETANSTETEALLVGGDRIAIEQDSTIMYEAQIIGTNASEKFGVRIKGIADDTSGTLSLIGSPSREILTENVSAWTADVAVDTVNNSLKITVVGSDATDVHWTIFVECNVVKR